MATVSRKATSWTFARLLGATPWALALAFLALASSACRPSDPSRPNLVLIVVDTLRSDHLSAAGYPRETSPILENLARRGTFFDRFYSHSAVTRPSVATLFTSRFVSGHGITNQGGAGLARELPSLPEILHRSGYSTRAFVTNPQIHPLLGFDRGFDRYERLFDRDVDPVRLQPGDLVKLPASEVFASAQESLAELRRRPFFYYIHLLDPHGPYQPPAEDLAIFADPDYRGVITGSIADFVRYAQFRSHPEDLDHFRALYDGEIRSMDRALGEFVDWLERSGHLDNTHLLLTADHGEEFMEHGATGHSFQLFEESIRVPLLWIGPGVPAGRRVGDVAGLVDVLPTVLDVLGVPRPEESLRGRSLRPLWTDDPSPRPWRPALFLEGLAKVRQGLQGPPVKRGIVTQTHKILARGCVAGQPGCETLEIFDLRVDPREQNGRTVTPGSADLTDEERDLVLLYELEEQRALGDGSPVFAPEIELPPEQLERLRSLGYLD